MWLRILMYLFEKKSIDATVTGFLQNASTSRQLFMRKS